MSIRSTVQGFAAAVTELGAGQASNAAASAAWDARLDRARIACQVSDRAREEVLRYWRESPLPPPGSDLRAPLGAMPHLCEEVEGWRHRLERRERMILVEPVAGLNFHQRRAFGWLVATLLGEPLVQNDNGDRVVSVWARPGGKRVIDGARYHQTREGGGPHTDNVSLPESWDYLVFSCIRPAMVGGESILISGFSVHQELLAFPAALEILRQPFWWEYRGIAEKLFQAPVITDNAEGEPLFRHLRKYLESAHQRAGAPLTDEQVWALDVLESLLELSRLEYRVRMEEGEILITYDSQVLHARTYFSDPSPHPPADGDEAATGSCRFFDRVWVKRDR
jgi:hypothetical protein